MPSSGCRGRGLEEPGLELLTMSAVIRPVTGGRDPLAGGNHRGMANDRDEIAVTTRLHPDDAEAVLGVLVGDPLNQPSKHLPVGWLWLRLHDAHRTGLVAKALARGAAVRRQSGGPLGSSATHERLRIVEVVRRAGRKQSCERGRPGSRGWGWRSLAAKDAGLEASRSLDRRSGGEVQWTEKRAHEVVELMFPVQEKAPRKAGPRD